MALPLICLMLIQLCTPAVAKEFTDDTHGVTVTYPDDVTLISDPAKIKEFLEAGLDAIKPTDEVRSAVQAIGLAFILIKAEGEQRGNSMNMTTESIPESLSINNPEEYYRAALPNLNKSLPEFRELEKPTSVQLNGKHFLRFAYSYVMNGTTVSMTDYIHYRKDKRWMYIFTMSKGDSTFENVMKSLKLTFK